MDPETFLHPVEILQFADDLIVFSSFARNQCTGEYHLIPEYITHVTLYMFSGKRRTYLLNCERAKLVLVARARNYIIED